MEALRGERTHARRGQSDWKSPPTPPISTSSLPSQSTPPSTYLLSPSSPNQSDVGRHRGGICSIWDPGHLASDTGQVPQVHALLPSAWTLFWHWDPDLQDVRISPEDPAKSGMVERYGFVLAGGEKCMVEGGFLLEGGFGWEDLC